MRVERSTAMFLVVTRLLSVSVGFSPAGNSAVTIPSASVLLSTELRGASFGSKFIRERPLVGRHAGEGYRQPYVRRARRIQDLDVRGHFERAPTAWQLLLCKQARRPRNGQSRGNDACGSKKITTVHSGSLLSVEMRTTGLK